MIRRGLPLALAVSLVVGPSCAKAQPAAPTVARSARPAPDAVLDALSRITSFAETAIAPDGSWIAWVEREHDDRGDTAIRLAPRAGHGARTVTAARDGRPHREHAVRFAPDGRSLAFLSDAGTPGQSQLYVAPTAGGPARRLTAVTGQLDDPRWSPDGRRIAVLFTAGSRQPPGALVAYAPDAGVVAEKVDEQRIAVVDAATGALREVSPADLYVYDYDWSPDGARFVAEAAEGSGTDNYWIASLRIVEADSGRTRTLWTPTLQIACPRFSPDGTSVAVIQGLMSDEGLSGGDVWVVPVDGSPARDVTPDVRASASALYWRPSGEIVFTAAQDGGTAVLSVRPGEAVTRLWSGPESLAQLRIARTGTLSTAVRQSFTAPPEVWAGEIGRWEAVTHANTGAATFWGAPKSLHWTSDGRQIQGWLLPPRDVDPARRYPLVVSVHGGPSAQATSSWPARWNAVLPAEGYFVLLPNPRGSYGQGEEFTRANVKDFGYGDLRDILAGVDAAAAAAPIDPERVGLIGWSYGGFMSMWAVTQTARFKAAVAGAGIANWQSYYGQNRIDRWMLPFFGASVYDDPAVYAKSSPINFIKNARTPTLVLHGDRDSEVPTPQGYEFWHALKTLGVPTQLVIYENEGHGVSRPEHLRDMERRIVEWFETYLRP